VNTLGTQSPTCFRTQCECHHQGVLILVRFVSYKEKRCFTTHHCSFMDHVWLCDWTILASRNADV